MIRPLTILGIDPGLRHTGWGVITQDGNRLSYVAAGRISPEANSLMANRLWDLAQHLTAIILKYKPDESAIEETFVNKNAGSALKLGQARGAAILTLAQNGLSVGEYAANRVKQAVTGHGHAEKIQILAMVKVLLPGCAAQTADAADALAVAITHAHHRVNPAIAVHSLR